LTALIVAQNNAETIARALASVAFADEVLVVDGGSEDATGEVARQMGARVIVNPWPGFGQQFRFATAQATGDWILRVDTDEVVSEELRAEIEAVLGRPDCPEVAWWISRPTVFLGRLLRHGGEYPNWTLRLWRRGAATFTTPEADEVLEPHEPAAPTGRLRGCMYHTPWADLAAPVRKHLRSSELQARDAIARGTRRQWPALTVWLCFPRKFGEVYLYKQGWRDGFPGLVVAMCKAFSVFLREAHLYLHEQEQGRR
jgi:glycosyltransferase involved in cell wall biosynthesis